MEVFVIANTDMVYVVSSRMVEDFDEFWQKCCRRMPFDNVVDFSPWSNQSIDELENMYPWESFVPLEWEQRQEHEEVPQFEWSTEAIANMEESGLLNFDEERELLQTLNINVVDMKMKSDNKFYIDLYDDEEDMEDLKEKYEQER